MEKSIQNESGNEIKPEDDIEISELTRSYLHGLPPVATIEDLKNPKELLQIKSTRRFRTPAKLFYRTLFIDKSRELVLIIPSNLSIAIARSGLSELKTLAIQIQEGITQEMPLGARIYLEYQLLVEKYGWTIRDMTEQINFDLLVSLLMMHKPGKEHEDIRKYGRDFADAIFDYLRIPKNRRQGYLNIWDGKLRDEKLPFAPGSGLIESESMKNMKWIRHEWKYQLAPSLNDQATVGFILLRFWLVGFSGGYWTYLDSHPELKGYNKANRNKLISLYLNELISHYSEWGIPKEFPQDSIEKFLRKLRLNLS